MNFTRVTRRITTQPGKKVISASVKVMAGDYTPNVYITDIQLQGGDVLSGWRPHDADVFQINMFGVFVIDLNYIDQLGKTIGS